MSSDVLSDFIGPSCLYHVLNDRFKRNPWYLRRNIRPKRKQKLSNETAINLRLQIPNNAISPKSVALIVFGGFRNDGEEKDSYQICGICTESRPANNVSLAAFDIHHKFTFDADLICRLNSLVLLVVANNSSGTESTFRKHGEKLALKVLNAYTKMIDVQIVKQRENYCCLVDLSDVLLQMRNQCVVHPSRERLLQPDFMEMAHPASTSKAVDIKLSECISSQIEFFGTDLERESEPQFRSIAAKLTVRVDHRSAQQSSSDSMSAPLLGIANNRHHRAASAAARNEKKTKEGKIIFHYHQRRPMHRVSALNPVDYDTFHDEVATFNCPFCTDCLCKEAASNLVIGNKPTKKSNKAFLELVTHLVAWHHHFDYEYWLDKFGSAHIRISRSSGNDNTPKIALSSKGHSRSSNRKTICFARKFYNPPQLIMRVIGESGYNSNATTKKISATSSAATIAKAASSQISGMDAYGRRNLTPFYHAATGQSVTVDEFYLYDSDDDHELDGKLQATKQTIDEYMDITAQEKTVFHLWNTHIATFPPYGDKLFPLNCYRFVTRFADVINRKGLRHGVLLHFLGMYDRGLLLAEEVAEFMTILDDYACKVSSSNASSNASISQQQKQQGGMKKA